MDNWRCVHYNRWDAENKGYQMSKKKDKKKGCAATFYKVYHDNDRTDWEPRIRYDNGPDVWYSYQVDDDGDDDWFEILHEDEDEVFELDDPDCYHGHVRGREDVIEDLRELNMNQAEYIEYLEDELDTAHLKIDHYREFMRDVIECLR